MSYLRVLYALPTPLFFSEGPCGRVTHAVGFCSGLVANQHDVTLLAADGASQYSLDEEVHYTPLRRASFIWYISFFKNLFLLSKSSDVIVIRWRPFLPFVLLPMGVFGWKVWLEVNAITGLNSKYRLVRALVNLSVVLSAKFFRIISVSENSKKQIQSLVRSSKVVVLRNGFTPGPLVGYEPVLKKGAGINLVYFGRKQNYYSWNMLYSVVKDIGIAEGVSLHVFGFEEDFSGFNFYGPFNQKELVVGLSKIENPVLVLHADASEIARSGSPMKLFEYAVSGLPCVISDSLTDQGGMFKGFSFYKAGDESSFKDAVKEVAKGYPDFLALANKNKQIALRECTWEAMVRQWCDHMA